MNDTFDDIVGVSVADTPPGMGHNLPPPETLPQLADPLDAAALRERLKEKYAALLDRIEELKIGCEQSPTTPITAEPEAQRILDFIAEQIRPAEDDAKKAHDIEKRPYLDCEHVVGEVLSLPIRELKKLYAPLHLRADRWMASKRQQVRLREEAARRAAAEEQRRQNEEAARLRAEQAKKIAAGQRPAAIEAGRKAQEAERAAAAAQAVIEAPPERVTIQGDYGAVGYSRTRWEYRVKDPRLVPKPYLTVDHDTVMHDINRKDDPVRDIPGLEIFPVEPLIIRRC